MRALARVRAASLLYSLKCVARLFASFSSSFVPDSETGWVRAPAVWGCWMMELGRGSGARL